MMAAQIPVLYFLLQLLILGFCLSSSEWLRPQPGGSDPRGQGLGGSPAASAFRTNPAASPHCTDQAIKKPGELKIAFTTILTSAALRTALQRNNSIVPHGVKAAAEEYFYFGGRIVKKTPHAQTIV